MGSGRARSVWRLVRRIAIPISVALVVVLVFSTAGSPWLRPSVLGGVGRLVQAVEDARNVAEEFPDTESEVAGTLAITHGVASGDVTASSAIIWTRASGPARMFVEYDADPTFQRPESGAIVQLLESTDYTGVVRLERLSPGTRYHYRVWLEQSGAGGPPTISESRAGTFGTAPEAPTSGPVSFVFGADLGGDGYCRRIHGGYEIFRVMQELAPDFFVAMGDMVYADRTCPANGPDGWRNRPGGFRDVDNLAVDWTNLAQLREIYLRHWSYNRADASLRAFLAAVPMYATWDDHEVINDFGGGWSHWNALNATRAGYSNLVEAGREAFFSYSPIDRDPAQPNRIYRSFNWGRHLDLFVLDTRSYRSRNDLPDTAENEKTMLGVEQLQWLMRGLAESTATWKAVVSSVTLSVPTGGPGAAIFGRDGWANGSGGDIASRTGFERELLDLIRFLDENRIANVVFLAGDIHQAASIRYEIDANDDGRPLVFHEFVVGPLSATTRAGQNPPLDPTLNPTLLYGEGGFFNFGFIRVDPQPDGEALLTADVRGADGRQRPGSLVVLRSSR